MLQKSPMVADNNINKSALRHSLLMATKKGRLSKLEEMWSSLHANVPEMIQLSEMALPEMAQFHRQSPTALEKNQR